MEITLIILTSTLISAFLLVSFMAGYFIGKKHEEKPREMPNITEDNKEYVKGLANFFDYKGE